MGKWRVTVESHTKKNEKRAISKSRSKRTEGLDGKSECVSAGSQLHETIKRGIHKKRGRMSKKEKTHKASKNLRCKQVLTIQISQREKMERMPPTPPQEKGNVQAEVVGGREKRKKHHSCNL